MRRGHLVYWWLHITKTCAPFPVSESLLCVYQISKIRLASVASLAAGADNRHGFTWSSSSWRLTTLLTDLSCTWAWLPVLPMLVELLDRRWHCLLFILLNLLVYVPAAPRARPRVPIFLYCTQEDAKQRLSQIVLKKTSWLRLTALYIIIYFIPYLITLFLINVLKMKKSIHINRGYYYHYYFT